MKIVAYSRRNTLKELKNPVSAWQHYVATCASGNPISAIVIEDGVAEFYFDRERSSNDEVHSCEMAEMLYIVARWRACIGIARSLQDSGPGDEYVRTDDQHLISYFSMLSLEPKFTENIRGRIHYVYDMANAISTFCERIIDPGLVDSGSAVSHMKTWKKVLVVRDNSEIH